MLCSEIIQYSITCIHSYRSPESVEPTTSSTELKSNHPQLPELSLLVPHTSQTLQTSQRSAPSVKVDEGIDDEDQHAVATVNY